MCVLLILLIVAFVIYGIYASERDHKKIREQEREYERQVGMRHREKILSSKEYDHQIVPTGDYKDVFGGGSESDGSYIWCKHHLDGSACAYCINRKAFEAGNYFTYGPNDASHCATRYYDF